MAPSPREQLIAKAFVSDRLGLDTRTCHATSGEAWVRLAIRLVTNREQAERTFTAAHRIRRYRRPYSL
jgi:hypothetical protein